MPPPVKTGELAFWLSLVRNRRMIFARYSALHVTEPRSASESMTAFRFYASLRPPSILFSSQLSICLDPQRDIFLSRAARTSYE